MTRTLSPWENIALAVFDQAQRDAECTTGSPYVRQDAIEFLENGRANPALKPLDAPENTR